LKSNDMQHDREDMPQDSKYDIKADSGSSAERVERAATTVETAASAVQSNVTMGIQPDIRDIRGLVVDVRDTVTIAFRRIFWAVIACLALNAVTLIVILSR
jgi:hypothetical protein